MPTASNTAPPKRIKSKYAAAGELDQGLLVRRAARFDTAGPGESVVCELANGSCLLMSPSAYWLYRELQQGNTPGQIATAIGHRFGQRFSVEEIAVACAGVLDRVRAESEKVASATRRRYVFRVRLVPERIVALLARRLTWLISGPALALWCCLVAAAAILYWKAGSAALAHAGINLGSTVIVAYLIYLLAPAAHELGHAAACVRYGVAAGEIGFAVYLVFPAIYCDVTRAWLLPRKQRLVVDIAGIWFEVAVGAVFSGLGVLFRAPVFLLASFMVLGNLIIALNPLGRFDSYWALSDAFGIADLSKQRSRVLRLAFGSRAAASPSGPSRPVSYAGLRRVVIISYTALTVFVISWYCYTAAGLAAPFADHLKLAAVAMARSFGAGRPAAGLHDLVDIGPGVLMFAVMFYRLGRMLTALLRKLAGARALKAGAPVRSGSDA
jgi:putative peptide zinc metalloprotease protein